MITLLGGAAVVIGMGVGAMFALISPGLGLIIVGIYLVSISWAIATRPE